MEYNYDNASRLTAITYTNTSTNTILGNLTYSYDKAGRWIGTGGSYARTGLPQPLTSATYNAANRMLTFGSESLTYDLNGNLTSDGTDTLTWDARNRLASLSGPGLTASFQYDPLGRRVSKSLNGSPAEFLYDGMNIVQELAGASVTARMLTGLGIDEVFSRTDVAGARSFLTDALGSVVALTDNTGAVQTEYTYEPFGETTVTGAATTNPFQYTGRENDGTTGLYYYRARYYHPVLQRFISEDPVEFEAGDVNLYGYVFNDPVNLVDPDGRFAFALPFAVVALDALVKAAIYTTYVSSALAAAVLTDYLLFSKGGPQRIRDSGLEGTSTEDLQDLYEKAKGAEKKRYEKELKARKERNKAKRCR